MEKTPANNKKRPSLLVPALSVSLIWSLIVLGSLLWNLYQHHMETKAIIINVARTHLEKDILFRDWVVRHGGVYVPVTKDTRPNPYLRPELFPERDITTPSGRVLTLINPAYMIRQLYELHPTHDLFFPRADISSLRPVRPENSPDQWEKEALLDFKRGSRQKGEFVEENGNTMVRVMKPVYATPGCLAKCHTVEGYKEGDVMGGLSVTVPMEPFAATTWHHTVVLIIAHLALWVLVLIGIGFAFAGMHKRTLARQRSEEALRRNEEHFRSLIENALDMITVLDENGVTTFESPSTQRKLGRPLPVMLHQSLVKMVHPDDRARVADVLVRLAARPGTTETFEMRCQHSDGSWRILEAVGHWIPEGLSPATYVINSRDITNRKNAEGKLLSYQKQLRSLATRLSQAEEETRRAIADELHEQVGQNLSVIKLKLGELRRTVSLPEAQEQFDSFGQLLEAIIRDTRTMTFELSPPILYDIGLEAAIAWTAEQFQAKNNIVCQVEDDGDEKPVATDLRNVLFRSIQEALINIVKYADAGRVTISLRREENFILIDIIDDGRGFDPTKLEKYEDHSEGFGLFSIRERLDLLGGHLTIHSAPGEGTKIAMTAPLNLNENGPDGTDTEDLR